MLMALSRRPAATRQRRGGLHMSSTTSRSNVGAIRSMQVDRGARIRTFRHLNFREREGHEDPPHLDANGEQYAQALDRLTSFKVRHKKRVWQNRKKNDWQEEDTHLKEVCKELMKSIQSYLKPAARDGSRYSVAPAWGGPSSTSGGGEVCDQRCGGIDGEKPLDTSKDGINCETEVKISSELPWHQRQLALAQEVTEISTVAQELDRSRFADFEADRSHIEQLRGLVEGFARKDCDGPGKALMADLLVQARMAQRKFGTSLAETARVLEAEVENSRQTLAAVLAPDPAERVSSVHNFVMASIGLGEGNQERAFRGSVSGGETGARASGGLKRPTSVGGIHEAMIRAEVTNRLEALEAEHSSKVAALQTEFLQQAAGPMSAGSVEAALDANGGWPADKHFRFMKVVKAAKGASSGFSGSGATLKKRLGDHLSGVSPAEISRHEVWYRLRCLQLARKKAEKQRYKRELEGLVTWAKKQIETLISEEAESAARAVEVEEHERRRAELDDMLREKGEAREKRRQKERERDAQALREKISKETEEAKRKVVQDEHKRAALAEYHASLQELRVREAEACEAARQAAEAERAQRVPINRERVGFRQDKARQRREENERREKETKALEAKRLQVLEKLAASVPYAEACANAEAKLDHVTAATAAHFTQFLPFDRSRGHCPTFGYNTETVFKDARFRLGLYLREAGVSGSKYAHSAVMRVAGPLPDAPYGKTG